MADYYTLLTNAGIAYETACKAAGVPIKLSQISVGDGGGAVYNPAATATALKREVWRGPLNALFQDEKNPSWLLAEVTIPPEEGGWYVREAGLWTDTGILYAIVKYPESFKPVLATSGSGKEFYIRSIFETSNASLVTLLIDDTVVKATKAWVMGYLADELASTRAEIEAMIAQASALPVGSMVAFPKATVPPGFLEVDGSVQSIATYPDLYAFLGTTFNTGGEGAGNFRLPESRGEFLRGWDHGRGVDAGRAIGSNQLDALQNIKGELSSRSFGSGVLGAITGGVSPSPFGSSRPSAGIGGSTPLGQAGGSVVTDLTLFDASLVARTSTETRPRNLAVMWCIKAWNAPINPGNIDVAALEAQVLTLNNKLSQLFKTPTDVKASRAINVTYTNSSTLPIVVNVALVGTAANQTATVMVDGVSIFGSSFPNTGLSLAVSAIIPAGSTYKVPTGSYTISNWVEIR
ncbi:phage tail protein [Pseudomonas sp. PDM04]|uniref:phage tail-collar fiber domain-containing protein n=1 Tax=Pseudomonas sp. PDM04 TaxID=2769296 RepID=UPI001CE0587C|nr:phage tail protein [Pseudomonas sp. PDM04]